MAATTDRKSIGFRPPETVSLGYLRNRAASVIRDTVAGERTLVAVTRFGREVAVIRPLRPEDTWKVPRRIPLNDFESHLFSFFRNIGLQKPWVIVDSDNGSCLAVIYSAAPDTVEGAQAAHKINAGLVPAPPAPDPRSKFAFWWGFMGAFSARCILHRIHRR